MKQQIFMNPVELSLGETLILLRKIHGLSREKLANTAGCSITEIRDIEIDSGEATAKSIVLAYAVFDRNIHISTKKHSPDQDETEV